MFVLLRLAAVARILRSPPISLRSDRHSDSYEFILLCRTCSQNPDPTFASCSVPQEWTDEEIDKGPHSSEVPHVQLQNLAAGLFEHA